jgi:hypothetical protein
MQRSISVLVVEDGQLAGLDFWIRRVLELTFDQKNGGLKLSGCGSDMGFELIYQLGRMLYPEGFGVKGVCENGAKRPLNEHHARKMVSEGVKFRGRNDDASGWDNDGGFALQQRQI